jgi:mannosyltransferase
MTVRSQQLTVIKTLVVPKAIAWSYRAAAVLIVGLGFALRLFHLDSESLWYDELLQVNLALADIPSMLRRLPLHAAVPLDYLISHYWILLGNSDAWVRIPAVVCGTLALPLAFQLGRRMLGVKEGLLFMLLFGLSPFHVRYSQEVRPYALGIMGVLLFSYGIWRLRETGRWRYFIFVQAGAIILALSHYFAVTTLGVWLIFLGLDVVFSQERRQPLKTLGWALAASLVALSFLLALGWGTTLLKVSGAFGETLIEPEKFVAAPVEKPNAGAGPKITQEFVEGLVLGPLGSGRGLSLWLFNSLVILGLLSLMAQEKYKLSLLLFLWVTLPIVGILAFLVHRGTFFAPRYIIFVLPAYIMLLTVGILSLPRWIKQTGPAWLAVAIFLIIGGLVVADLRTDLVRLYYNKDKEDWRLVGKFITNNAKPDDAIITVKAEPTMNWYYPPATIDGNTYDNLEIIQETVAKAPRSFVILSIYSSGMDTNIKAWLSDGEQGAIRMQLDPVITVYYLGDHVDKEQLLREIQGFALPVDHALYASLARENRRNPAVAQQYYRLAIDHAPDEETRAQYQAAMEALGL